MKFPKHSKIVFTQEEVSSSIQTLALTITNQLKDENPIVISILNGGLMFTGALLQYCTFALEQDYLHATRYGNEIVGNELIWKSQPTLMMESRTVLLLDDIFDEGKTLEAVHTYCINKKAKKVYSAVLVKKEKNRPISFEPDFYALKEKNDDYLFGMGMDYKGYWRNLNDIHALTK